MECQIIFSQLNFKNHFKKKQKVNSKTKVMRNDLRIEVLREFKKLNISEVLITEFKAGL